jgi:crotonobetainyl-CoA:carnitine CoA-transferase CaiB-like acyl-CoA transferase
MNNVNNAALQGIRIADFGHVLAGPYATMLLGALGAEVIKIETRSRPDEQRVQHGAGASSDYESSSNFFEINLNKLSVSLDLSKDQGRELARRIVGISDVVMENMRPGVMDKLGLGYKDLAKVKSDIIMLSLSGYGGTGPYRGYTAYAPCFSCFGGQAVLTGYADAEPNTLTSSCDSRAGTAGTFAILMALNLRDQTGEGQYIDLSSSEMLNAMVGDQMMEYSMNGRSPTRDGNHDAIMAPHNVYRCKGNDRWISIAVATDEEWQGLRQAMGDPEWARDEVFATRYDRWRNQGRLDELLQAWTVDKGHYELMQLLQRHGVAAMPSFKAKDLFSDPHVMARGGIADIQHPVLGTRKTITPPWALSQTPARIARTAPLLGEHNKYVLGELLGIPQAELARLVEDRVVY